MCARRLMFLQEKPRRRGDTGASGFRLRGETSGGEGNPPQSYSNGLMCLFSNAHDLLCCVVLSPLSSHLEPLW
jgi:hypothetical protein